LQMMAAKDLDIGPGYESVFLPPPAPEIAAAGTFFAGHITCGGKTVGDLMLTLTISTSIPGRRRSGSGKTTAVFNVLRSAYDNSIKFLVLDWKNEYRS